MSPAPPKAKPPDPIATKSASCPYSQAAWQQIQRQQGATRPEPDQTAYPKRLVCSRLLHFPSPQPDQPTVIKEQAGSAGRFLCRPGKTFKIGKETVKKSNLPPNRG